MKNGHDPMWGLVIVFALIFLFGTGVVYRF